MTGVYSAVTISPAALQMGPQTAAAGLPAGGEDILGEQFSNMLSLLSGAMLAGAQTPDLQASKTNADQTVSSPIPIAKNTLQDFLDSFKDGQNGALSGKILLALTPGTPISSQVDLNGLADLLQMSQDQAQQYLQGLMAQASGQNNGNVLLIAVPTSPAGMDKFLQDLRNGLAQFQNSSDATNQNGSLPMALVQFLPQDDSADGSSQPVVSLWNISAAANSDDLTLTDVNTDLSQNGDDFDQTLLIVPINLLALQQNQTTSAQDDSDFLNSDILAGASQPSIFAAHGDGFGQKSLKPFEVSQNSLLDGQDYHVDQGNEVSASLVEGGTQSISSSLSLNTKGGNESFIEILRSKSGSLTAGSDDLLQNLVYGTAGNGLSQAQLTNPTLQNTAATSSHGASQLVQAALQNNFQDGKIKNQQLSLELDPPELGRVQVFLSYEKGETMKVHVSAERESSLEILRKDSQSLLETLQRAGIKTDGSSLSFDMSQGGGGFGQALFGQNQQNQSSNYRNFSLDGTGQDGVTGDITQVSLPVLTDHPHVITDGTAGGERYDIVV